MMKEVLSYFPLKHLPLFGLSLFLLVFLGIVIWVNRKGSSQIYEEASRLPLREGMSHE